MAFVQLKDRDTPKRMSASPPHGLALPESGDEIQLNSAPDCRPLVERFLDIPRPEPLSQAAIEILSIVAYEQPVTRANITQIRATDSSGGIKHAPRAWLHR